ILTTSNVREAAISPDGKYIATVVEDGGQQSIRVQQTANAGGSTTLTSGGSEFRGLVFSRDGYSVYYLAREDKILAIYQVSVLGGASRKLIDDVITPLALSPEGAQMAFVRRKENGTALIIANADGGAER